MAKNNYGGYKKYGRRKPYKPIGGTKLLQYGKKFRGNRLSNNNLVISPRATCPGRIIVPLKLVSPKFTITCTAGAGNYHLWSFNDLIQPNMTGGGSQKPTGFNEWATFYGRYRVMSASIDVWAKNDTDSNPFRIVLSTSGTTGGSGDEDLAQAQRGKERFGGDQAKVIHVGMKRTGAQIFNSNKRRYMIDDVFGAAVTSTPSAEGMFQIWAAPFDESTTTTISLKVEITYNVLFTVPKFLSAST